MAALTTNVVPLTGLRFDDLLAASPANAGGDDCATGAGVLLVVKNTDTTAKTVTLVTPETVDGDLAVADRAVTVVATTGLSLIPVTDRYRNPSTGRCSITYSAVTGVTVCVVRTATS
ncbi:hypothetical protein NLX86_18790 [Streptomyces sp. A3M-1-3]|uniref:hypothetical protein n=1 Tax=Streptomyces sp. A3M-1-3 TaxID=2962044 RepID=UPI0020B6C3EF|nr:hypothetical protein [Streptomyces sp. A3M-1-3]MCP3820065.1 hypothetical protein [Streptomyces sp. A3M-1-3]